MMVPIKDNWASGFQQVSMLCRPRIRWWIPGTYVTQEELVKEITRIKQAGFSGAEVCPMPFCVSEDGFAKIDWGNEHWNSLMKGLLQAAGRLDFTIDFTMTPSWPLALPTIRDVDNPAQGAQMELDGAFVAGISRDTPFHGAVPVSAEAVEDAKRAGGSVRLLAVTVAKYADKERHILQYDSAAMLEIGDTVKKTGENGTSYIVDFSPQDDGEYVLFSWWQHPSGEKTCGYHQVDHYGRAGTARLIDFWENTMIPYYGEDFKNVQSLFVDSLEYRTHLDWTLGFPEFFRNKNGYDFTPYLPVVYDTDCIGNFEGEPVPDFRFDRNGLQLTNDFKELLTDLYVENHLNPLEAFCKRHGVGLRYQTAYGKNLELARTAMHVTVPETETLYGKDIIDFYRLQAGAVHMADKPIYSIEASAEWNGRGNGDKDSGNYQQTFRNQLWHIQRAFAAGVNQVVFHGYSYNGQYNGEDNDNGFIPGVTWPGYEAFGSVYGPSNSWGERQPNWAHIKKYTDFIARNQYVLRQGTSKVDLAVYAHRYYETIDFNGAKKIFDDSLLEQSGYTYDFIGPSQLKGRNAEVRDGRLYMDGPAYQAILLNNQTDLPVRTAQKLLKYSQDGLPILLIGDLPNQPSFSGKGGIESILREMLQCRNVTRVATVLEVLPALEKLGIFPDASYEGRQKLLSVHRKTQDTDFYWFYNYGSANTYREIGGMRDVNSMVSVCGSGQPYRLNPWTGEIAPVPVCGRSGGRVSFRVVLARNDSTVFAVTEKNKPEFCASDFLDDTMCTTKYLSEKHKTLVLKNWELFIERWTPGKLPSETEKQMTGPFRLEFPMPWNRIEGYERASGVGYYRTRFSMDSGWLENAGVILAFGDIEDSFSIRVNGNTVPVDEMNTTADISRYVKSGENELEIEVASTLLNAVVDFCNQQLGAKQDTRKLSVCGISGEISIFCIAGGKHDPLFHQPTVPENI